VTIPISMYAQLPILIVVVSLVYSAARYDRWDLILREAFRWGSRMVVFLVCIAAALFLVASYIDAH
jgi:hypothetical protein